MTTRPLRVVSLVPSLSRTVLELGLPQECLVGRTAWCVSPPGLARVRPVGGTKTPMIARILALEPDVILMDREENRLQDYEALRAAGASIFLSDTRHVDDVPSLLEHLGERLGLPLAFRHARDLRHCLGISCTPSRRPRVLPLIWKDPLMALAGDRYGGSLLEKAGMTLALPDGSTGYSTLTAEDLVSLAPEWLLLSSEPWAFTLAEGRQLQRGPLVMKTPPGIRLIDGRLLTWFGTDSLPGLLYLSSLRRELLRG